MIVHDVLVSRIRDVLNEHEGESLLGIAPDRILIEDYIRRAIADAVVLLAAKGYRINEKKILDDPEVLTKKKNVYVLPDGFISLIDVKLEEWRRAVVKLTGREEPAYRIAMNEYTSPGINSPICIKENERLVCMPGGSDAEYINVNVAYSGTELNAEERETNAVVYMAAAIVMGIFENDNGKQRLSEIATQYLQ